MADKGDDDVPRIGRGRFFTRVSMDQIVKILMMLVALVAIVYMAGPCGQGASKWFNEVAPTGQADARR